MAHLIPQIVTLKKMFEVEGTLADPLRAIEVENGTQFLKISNQLVVNVPPECTHLIVTLHANGSVRLTAVEANIPSLGAYQDSNKHVIMVPISQ